MVFVVWPRERERESKERRLLLAIRWSSYTDDMTDVQRCKRVAIGGHFFFQRQLRDCGEKVVARTHTNSAQHTILKGFIFVLRLSSWEEKWDNSNVLVVRCAGFGVRVAIRSSHRARRSVRQAGWRWWRTIRRMLQSFVGVP